MGQGATGHKVPEAARFIDLSDYGRPVAVWIAQRLRNTSVTAPSVTIVWTAIGLAGAACYAIGGYELALLGTAALQAKNILDAADGSLARLQNRPSRVGRFLDTIADAAVAFAVFVALAIAVSRARPVTYAAVLAGSALVLGLLQGSVFNFYYVRYRSRQRGDTTSRVVESVTPEDELHYAGRPFALGLLRVLILAYNAIYGWQDLLVRRLDRWAAAPLRQIGRADQAEGLRDDRRLLTAVSALGPGLQILILNLYTLAGRTELALALELFLWTIAAGGTFYAGALLLRLRRAAARGAAKAARAGSDSGV